MLRKALLVVPAFVAAVLAACSGSSSSDILGPSPGRAAFSDVHITDMSGPSSIGSCPISAGGLVGQQKALEYLFFDLNACVQDDAEAPVAPK